jgi:hypothetical protein
MYEQTLELTKRVLGEEHPVTLASMNNLALVLDNQVKVREGGAEASRDAGAV